MPGSRPSSLDLAIEPQIASDAANLRVIEILDQRRDGVRRELLAGVGEDEDLAASRCDAMVEGNGLAGGRELDGAGTLRYGATAISGWSVEPSDATMISSGPG